MKRMTLTIIAASMLLVSCKDNTNSNADLAENNNTSIEPQKTVEDEYLYIYENDVPENPYSKDDAEKMASEMKENVSVDEGNLSIQNFKAYGELINQVRNLSISPDVRDDMSSKRAYKAFNTFLEEMPAYLKTNMVRKEVQDVQNAMTRLETSLNNNASDRIVAKHINKVKEEVEDLNNEIVDARMALERNNDIDYAAYRDFVNNVSFDNAYVVTIRDFEDYNRVSQDREQMNTASDDEKMTYASTLINDFNQMVSNMPAYLKIDDVMDAVEDVQKEMKEYQNEKENPEIEMEEHFENLEEIDEALYDLNKELIKARQNYAEDRRDALEEYMEQLNK